MRRMVGVTLVLSGFTAACLHKGPSSAHGDIDVVITNSNPYPVCVIDMLTDDSSIPPITLVSEYGSAPLTQLAPGADVRVGVSAQTFLVESTACDHSQTGNQKFAISGPTHIFIGGAPNPAASGGYVSFQLPMVQTGGSFEEPSGGGGEEAPAGGGACNAGSCTTGETYCSRSSGRCEPLKPNGARCEYIDECHAHCDNHVCS